MSQLLTKPIIGIGFALLSPAALAANLEELQTFVGGVGVYMLLLIVIIVGAYAYFMTIQDKRATPLNKIFAASDTIHSVAPNTLVTDCVRAMSAKKIGAMLVMDGESVAGIFTERDALNRVLAAGLDPRSTKVSEVMTKDPYCLPPTTTVGAAMELVTTRRFRHLPIVENGRVLALISSGDLTHWLVKDQMRGAQELGDLASDPDHGPMGRAS